MVSEAPHGPGDTTPDRDDDGSPRADDAEAGQVANDEAQVEADQSQADLNTVQWDDE